MAAAGVGAAAMGLGGVAKAGYGDPNPNGNYIRRAEWIEITDPNDSKYPGYWQCTGDAAQPNDAGICVYPLDWAVEFGDAYQWYYEVNNLKEFGTSYYFYYDDDNAGEVSTPSDLHLLVKEAGIDPEEVNEYLFENETHTTGTVLSPDDETIFNVYISLYDHVVDGNDMPPLKDVDVVKNNAPNPPEYPVVEIPEQFGQEYIFFYWPPPEPDEEPEPVVEWLDTASQLRQFVQGWGLSDYNDFLYIDPPWEGGEPVGLSPEDQLIYNGYDDSSLRLEELRTQWQDLMDDLWLSFYGLDFVHVQWAIDNSSNVILQPATPSDIPMYFYFGKGGSGSVGHVQITRDVKIMGEPGNIPLPMKGTLPDTAMSDRSTIYGGGAELDAEFPTAGPISMTLENPPIDDETAAGFNLTVENVHFDRYQLAGIVVEASREMVEIKNCVFSNPVAGLNWSGAYGVLAANALRIGIGEGDPNHKEVYLNGNFLVKDCFFYLDDSGVEAGGILMDTSDSLANFEATGNHISARDYETWNSHGIWCRALPNTLMHIHHNPMIRANWGISIGRHFGIPPGKAIITDNENIIVDGLIVAAWSSGIDFVGSDEESLIENNHVTLNGSTGTGISAYQCSNCTLQYNEVKTGDPLPFDPFGPISLFGINADGETNPERVDEGRITSNNTIYHNKLIGNFQIGSVARDTDGMVFEQNDFSQASCYDFWNAVDNSYDPAIIKSAQLVIGPGATNGLFKNNKFGPVYKVVAATEDDMPILDEKELYGPTVYIGQSWYHAIFDDYWNENPLSDIRLEANVYSDTGLPGWKAIWASPGVAELDGPGGCIFAGFNTKKVTFDEMIFPAGTTACDQILDLGSANHILDEQNKNLNCNKIQDTSILRAFFNEHRMPNIGKRMAHQDWRHFGKPSPMKWPSYWRCVQNGGTWNSETGECEYGEED